MVVSVLGHPDILPLHVATRLNRMIIRSIVFGVVFLHIRACYRGFEGIRRSVSCRYLMLGQGIS